MSTLTHGLVRPARHPVDIRVPEALEGRDRLTTAFRPILAIPHLLLVGAPLAASLSWLGLPSGEGGRWASGGGVLGAAAGVAAMIAWFALLFTGRYPDGLRRLAELYLRWRVRAVAYTALLRDEYPPFADAPYPAGLVLATPDQPRDRLTVGFRLFLALPQLVCVWTLGVAWFFTTLAAWCSILVSGKYPRGLYAFGVGVMRWTTRVEAYLLLLHDEYPPFSFDA
jgi:hypothetical protein